LSNLNDLDESQLLNKLLKLQETEVVEACKTSLGAFTKLMWHLIEPSTPYKHTWHIDALNEHLEAVTKGQIRNLIINIPPRHMKSVSVSVMWPTWVWITRPESRWIFGSYSHNFALRDASRMRSILKSPIFQRLFKPQWTFLDDQDQKTKFENSVRGFRFTTAVGGIVTGEGGDFLVADDPINALDAESEVAREAAYQWWTKAMSTRGNDPKKVAKVVVMQRLHEKDLAGRLLSEFSGMYEELILPAEYDGPRKVTSIGWTDPRKEKGELMWPEHFGRPELEELKKNLGSRGTSAQLQQNPKPADGGLFKRHWWGAYKEQPLDIETIVQFWDCANKPGISNDYSICATWAKTPKGFFLLDLWREKVEAPDLERAAVRNFNKWMPSAVVIEDKANGTPLIQYLRRSHRHIPVLPYNPQARDKQVRASAATPTVESGNCYLPADAAWCEAFISEHEKFPNADHDDMVDTTSMFVEYFLRRANFQPRVRSLS